MEGEEGRERKEIGGREVGRQEEEHWSVVLFSASLAGSTLGRCRPLQPRPAPHQLQVC